MCNESCIASPLAKTCTGTKILKCTGHLNNLSSDCNSNQYAKEIIVIRKSIAHTRTSPRTPSQAAGASDVGEHLLEDRKFGCASGRLDTVQGKGVRRCAAARNRDRVTPLEPSCVCERVTHTAAQSVTPSFTHTHTLRIVLVQRHTTMPLDCATFVLSHTHTHKENAFENCTWEQSAGLTAPSCQCLSSPHHHQPRSPVGWGGGLPSPFNCNELGDRWGELGFLRSQLMVEREDLHCIILYSYTSLQAL